MGEVHSLSKLKALKQINKDLKQLLPVIETAIKSFNNYKHYVPIATILLTLKEQQDVMKHQLEKVEKIYLTEKGKV